MGEEELWKQLFICALLFFSGAHKRDRRDHLSVDSLKEKRKAKEKRRAYLMFSLTRSLSFFMRRCLCLQSLYLPFISASLALLVGRVSGRQSLSPSLWCFCRLQRGLWSHCTPHCQGLRRAHAICQIDGKVAEWGLRHPLLIHTFVFYVSRLDVVWKPHLCNLLLATRLKRWPPQHTNTQTGENNGPP